MSRSFLAEAAERMSQARRVELRDHFAGQALAGILASPQFERDGIVPTNPDGAAFIALNAYAFADAMLVAREKVSPESEGPK